MAVQKYGLFGWPVKHSVSPAMQEAGFRAVGIDGSYELFEVPTEGLGDKVAELKEAGYRGWNITVPHKTAMLEFVDEVDPTAEKAQSINTVINRNGRLFACSTDGYGLEMSVKRSFGLELMGNRFLFWGAGGAAKATATHFAAAGAKAVTLVNRTVSKAEALADIIRGIAPDCQVAAIGLADETAIADAMSTIDVLIQSTSVGLHADDTIAVPEAYLRADLNVVDMIYRETKLAAAAKALGCKVANGRDMLLYQGARAFELWTGVESAPVEAMGKALDEALKGR